MAGHLSRRERKALRKAERTEGQARAGGRKGNGAAAETVPTIKIDMAAVRAMFLQHHDIVFAPITVDQLVKMNTVIVGNNGIFLHKKLPLADMTMKLAEMKAFPMLPTIHQSVDIHVPKLPWKMLMQIFSFFKEVNKTIKTEAYVQCLWFPELDAWEVYVPKQTVTGGTVKHTGERGDRLVRGHEALHVWDIHSHGSMGPFFSPTDDADEGRSHRFNGVVGNLSDSVPQMKVRISDGMDHFLEPQLGAMIEIPEQKMTFEMDPLDLLTSKGPKLSLPGETVPQEWHDQLEEPEPAPRYIGGNGQGGRGHHGGGHNDVYGSVVADTPQRGDGLGPRSQRNETDYTEGREQRRAGYDVRDHRRFSGSEDTRRHWGLLPASTSRGEES